MMYQRIFFLALLTLTSGKSLVPNAATLFGTTRSSRARLLGPRGGSTKGAAAVVEQQESASASASATPSSVYDAGEVIVGDPAENKGPLKVLFLSSDTGGGHRASAESLAKQFLIHYPGSTYELLDIWSTDGCWPYKTLVESYQHLSSHPNQWRMTYHASNTKPWELVMDWHSTALCERKIRRRIESYEPDVVVSVHPAMNNVPIISTRKISRKTGKHIPFFTVVTDLGSGHATWFQKNVEKLYVASKRLYTLAKRRGKTPDANIVMTGLPIRHDFAVQADNMSNDRTTETGKAYRIKVKQDLGVDPSRPMILVMGGGEGVGALSHIVDELYTSLTKQGVDATIYVVCGRNDKLKNDLAERDWDAVLNGEHKVVKRKFLSRILHRRRSKEIQETLERVHHDHEVEDKAEAEGTVPKHARGKVDVVGLGFVTNMAEYMAAADVLVTKAGPGTIAEAAAVGLPVMLTSYLPGQEAGNVDYVLEKGFGDFCDEPEEIADEVACWLQDDKLMESMSHLAHSCGHPHAAADIVLDIGSRAHTWIALNGGSTGPSSPKA